MFVTYKRQRRKLQRRLYPLEEELFQRIIREIDEPTLEVMLGLRPRPTPKPKPTSNFASQLEHAIGRR
jgi:hypothetical protein